MDEEQNKVTGDNLRDGRETGIGTGKKTGLYGCGFLMLAVVIIFIVLALTGFYNPFRGTEGVGP